MEIYLTDVCTRYKIYNYIEWFSDNTRSSNVNLLQQRSTSTGVLLLAQTNTHHDEEQLCIQGLLHVQKQLVEMMGA